MEIKNLGYVLTSVITAFSLKEILSSLKVKYLGQGIKPSISQPNLAPKIDKLCIISHHIGNACAMFGLLSMKIVQAIVI